MEVGPVGHIVTSWTGPPHAPTFTAATPLLTTAAGAKWAKLRRAVCLSRPTVPFDYCSSAHATTCYAAASSSCSPTCRSTRSCARSAGAPRQRGEEDTGERATALCRVGTQRARRRTLPRKPLKRGRWWRLATGRRDRRRDPHLRCSARMGFPRRTKKRGASSQARSRSTASSSRPAHRIRPVRSRAVSLGAKNIGLVRGRRRTVTVPASSDRMAKPQVRKNAQDRHQHAHYVGARQRFSAYESCRLPSSCPTDAGVAPASTSRRRYGCVSNAGLRSSSVVFRMPIIGAPLQGRWHAAQDRVQGSTSRSRSKLSARSALLRAGGLTNPPSTAPPRRRGPLAPSAPPPNRLRPAFAGRRYPLLSSVPPRALEQIEECRPPRRARHPAPSARQPPRIIGARQ